MKTEPKEEEWDAVIKPQSSLFNLRLDEVWRYRDLMLMFVRRDFVSQYKQTILGPIWFIIQPLLTTFAFLIVFGRIAKISTGVNIPQPLFYLSGIIVWSYFAECLIKTSTVFRDNASIFGKVYFPRLIMPLSIVTSNLIRFGVQLLLFIVVLLYYIIFENYSPNFSSFIFLLPVLVIIMAILALSIGMIVSSLTTKYRDLAFLISFGVQLFMYATPIIYSLDSVSGKALSILKWNPVAPIVEGVRKGIFNQGHFSLGYLGYSIGVTFTLLILAIIIFNRVERSFVDTV